ncbi:MAG: aminotransferase class V-fold PLP-dependent enzyme [Woeseiaceae bacterium]
MQAPIYLDYNATTPVDPKVIETINVYLTNHFGNPSSSHSYGQHPHEAIAWARQHVAELIDATQDEIVFTGSASEANNMAILGTARALR